MVCSTCNKESSNRRVCPFCFTPYPAEGPQSRASTSVGRMSSAGRQAPPVPTLQLGPLEPLRIWFVQQTAIVRWSAAGIVAVGLLWAFTSGEELPTSSAPSTVPAGIGAPTMSREEAVALIRHTRETALVEEQSDEVTVSYPAAAFPVLSEGQVMLAMRFARADEVVMTRKRRISFHSPSGKMFAQSDAITGLTVVR